MRSAIILPFWYSQKIWNKLWQGKKKYPNCHGYWSARTPEENIQTITFVFLTPQNSFLLFVSPRPFLKCTLRLLGPICNTVIWKLWILMLQSLDFFNTRINVLLSTWLALGSIFPVRVRAPGLIWFLALREIHGESLVLVVCWPDVSPKSDCHWSRLCGHKTRISC